MLKPNYKYRLTDIFVLAWRCCKRYTALLVLLFLLGGCIPLLSTYAGSNFIDKTVLYLGGTGHTSAIFRPAALLLAAVFLNHFSGILQALSEIKLTLDFQLQLKPLLLQHKAALKYHYLEDEKSWDLISRVTEDPEQYFIKILTDTLRTIQLISKTAGTLILLSYYVWWTAAILVLVLGPFCVLAVHSGKANYDTKKQVTGMVRQSHDLGEVLNGRDYVMERTLFKYSTQISQKWKELYENTRIRQYRTERKWYIRMKSGGLLTACFCIFTLFLLLFPALNGQLTIGLFMAMVNLLFDLIGGMSWQLSASIDSLTQDLNIIHDLTCFMELETNSNYLEGTSSAAPRFDSLEFRNVTFAYPGSEAPVLKNLSFRIDSGRHYAFVGANGSGKSTILKLMTGLYEQYEGQILINGQRLPCFSPAELHRFFAPVFQDYARYSLSFRENIDLHALAAGCPSSENTLYDVLKNLHMDLPAQVKKDGLDVPLGKLESGGTDLSGGQWQKAALARALLIPAPVCLLDEPTAALDAVSESEVYHNFDQISRKRTTICNSHRLVSAKKADHIFVLADGKIREMGTHSELQKKGSLYYRMYETQKGWYL